MLYCILLILVDIPASVKMLGTISCIFCLCGASTSIGAAPKENDKSPAASPTPVESENPITALKAHTLYTLRNPYVGDASANGKLLYALEDILPSGAYRTELDTEESPYVLRLAYEEEPMEGEHEASAKMNVAGTLLLALIDNLQEVQWTYPIENSGEKTNYTGYWNLNDVSASYSCEPEDVKDFGRSEENLQKLLDKFTESISTIGGADGPTSNLEQQPRFLTP